MNTLQRYCNMTLLFSIFSNGVVFDVVVVDVGVEDRISFAMDEDLFRLFLRGVVVVDVFIMITLGFVSEGVGEDCLSATCQSVFTPRARLHTERPISVIEMMWD